MFQAHLVEQHFKNLTTKFFSSLGQDFSGLKVDLEEQLYNQTYDPYIDGLNIRYKLYLENSNSRLDNYYLVEDETYQMAVFIYIPNDCIDRLDILFIKDAYFEYLKENLNLFSNETSYELRLSKDTIERYKEKFKKTLSLVGLKKLDLANTVSCEVTSASVEKYTETDTVVAFDMRVGLHVRTSRKRS